MNYDLTTAEGREEASKYLSSFMATIGMLIPPVGIGIATVEGLVSLLSRKDIISAQKELAEELIKTGKENGVDSMEITVDNKVGMNFGATFDGVPLNALLGSNGKMTLKVKFK
ncbi:MAG: hypothetical protein J6I73_04615 [Treponema sp.]|nr:hypothetical protein [Treponema sp.]